MVIVNRFKVGIQYCGSQYSGFALNCNAKSLSILGKVQDALNTFQVDLFKTTPPSTSSTSSSSSPSTESTTIYDPIVLRNGLNYYLDAKASQIHITDVTRIPMDEDVRYTATARTYMYRILSQPSTFQLRHAPSTLVFHNQISSHARWSLYHQQIAWVIENPLNLPAMYQATQYLLGTQDFQSFQNSGCQSNTTIREMKEILLYCNKQLINQTTSISTSPFHPSQSSSSSLASTSNLFQPHQPNFQSSLTQDQSIMPPPYLSLMVSGILIHSLREQSSVVNLFYYVLNRMRKRWKRLSFSSQQIPFCSVWYGIWWVCW
jgi:tRNA pseudouridine(38-40) synthase